MIITLTTPKDGRAYNNRDSFEVIPDSIDKQFLVAFVPERLSDIHKAQLMIADAYEYEDYFLHEKICLLGFKSLNAEIKMFRLKHTIIVEGEARPQEKVGEKSKRKQRKVKIMNDFERIAYYESNKSKNLFKKV